MTDAIEYYSPNHLSVIIPFLTKEPSWLLLGGPADANEAQFAVKTWPDIKVLGVELNPRAIHWQKHVGLWPDGHPLLHYALWSKDSVEVPLSNPAGTLRSGRVYRAEDYPDQYVDVDSLPSAVTITWDTLDKLYGPFDNAVLWMDIEGSEAEAIKGAVGLLERGAIRLVNVEVLTRLKRQNDEMEALLTRYGFVQVHRWNHSESCQDKVFVKK